MKFNFTDQDLINIQQGICTTKDSGQRTVTERVIVDDVKHDECCTDPTRATIIDANAFHLGGECEVEFDVTNEALAPASLIRIGGPGNDCAEALGITPGPGVGVTTDFGGNPQTSGESLNCWNEVFGQPGVLINGLCIEVRSGTVPKVTLNELDPNLEQCAKKVITPICPPCPEEDGTTTRCWNFCFAVIESRWVEITVPVDADYTVKVNTGAYGAGRAFIKCKA